MEALKEIHLLFYRDFPPHPQEQVYGFATPSTKWSYPGGGINQIPDECTISGDVSVKDVMNKLQEYVDDINDNVEKLETRGPVSKFVLADENLRGSLTLTFDEATSGVACNLDSRGFHVLCKATEEVVGARKALFNYCEFATRSRFTGRRFDVRTAGYGLMATYHAKNEYCLFEDTSQGHRVFACIIAQLED